MDRKKIECFAAQIRLETAKCVAARGFGHLGGALSIVDLLAVLYGEVMKIDPTDPAWDKRDLFVCSKGHAGPAVYATLALKGYFPMDMLKTLNRPGTNLPSHCDRNKTPGIDMTTGSLGQGASLAVGMALGVKDTERRVFAVVGDGECDEGQVWEAAMFANQYKLSNLTLFVDKNKKQLDGYTDDIMNLLDVAAKFRAFGWDAQEIDGSDVGAIFTAIEKAGKTEGPCVIVLDTVKGAGIPAIENMASNHHIVFKDELAEQSIALLEAELAEKEAE